MSILFRTYIIVKVAEKKDIGMSKQSDLRFFNITFEDETGKIGSSVFSNSKDIEKYHDFFEVKYLLILNY